MKPHYIYGLIIALIVYPSAVQASPNGVSCVVEVSHPFDILESTDGMASWFDLQTNYYCVTNPTGNMFFRGLNEETNYVSGGSPPGPSITNYINLYGYLYHTNGDSTVTISPLTFDDGINGGTNMCETNIWPDGRGQGYTLFYDGYSPKTNEVIVATLTEGQEIRGNWYVAHPIHLTNFPNIIYTPMPYFYNFNSNITIKTLRVTNN
jgi:hypothetical protein